MHRVCFKSQWYLFCKTTPVVVQLAGDMWPTSTCLTPPNSVPLCGRRSPPHTGCVGEDTTPLVATVKGSLIPLVTDSMTRCVGGSLGTKVAHQEPSTLVQVDQLTPITWKELVSHVAPPRQHIWTFAAGVDEQRSYPDEQCPCVTGSTNGNLVPS